MDFEVELKGGAPWGFRIQGGKEFHSAIKITFLKPGGKAAKCQGIRIGDMLTHINEVATSALTHTQAEMQIKRAGTSLKLSLQRKVPPKPEPVAQPAEDNVDGAEDVPPLTPRRRTASVPARPETTKTVSDKEKDPDWYKSMFKTVHQGVELKATPMGGEEKVTRAPVKKKASVYEMEVQKTNDYNYERSRRPSRQSLTGRPTPSLSVLALGKSHEEGAPVKQYHDSVFEGSEGSESSYSGSRKGSQGSVIEEVQEVVELDEVFKKPTRRATEGARPMAYRKPVVVDRYAMLGSESELYASVSSVSESVGSVKSEPAEQAVAENKEVEMPSVADFLGVPSVSNLAEASELLDTQSSQSVAKGELLGAEVSSEEEMTLSEPVKTTAEVPVETPAEVNLGTEIIEKETVIEAIERELEIVEDVGTKKEVSIEDEENKENLKPEPKVEEKLASTPIKEVDDSDLSDGEVIINTLSITDPDASDHSLPDAAALSGVISRTDIPNDLVLLSAITSPPKSGEGIKTIPKEQIPEFV